MTDQRSLLTDATVYLSGPMDFVMSRSDEATCGWRARITDVLQKWNVRVFDPWYKPLVRNLGRYGVEDETTTRERERWRFDDTAQGAKARAGLATEFWKVMHIDLRMVDLSDFVVACCPTNLYSVGTPHEIVAARLQHKPVLLVSPPVRYPRWRELRRALAARPRLRDLLDAASTEGVVRENRKGVPSQWYMRLVDSESFFDGFGWEDYKQIFNWPDNYLDEREAGRYRPARPLLPFLDGLQHGRLPRRWDPGSEQYLDNDDWLLLSRQTTERP